MFFVDTQTYPDTNPVPNGAGISARLAFEGDPAGFLELWVSHSAAQSMAADFTGADPDSVTPEQAAEVVTETANMICGSLLSRIESTSLFRLATPQIVDTGFDSSAAEDTASFTAWIGSGALKATLRLGERNPRAEEKLVRGKDDSMADFPMISGRDL